MADRTPDYDVERLRLELEIAEHEDTIARGQSRIAEIKSQKERNLQRVTIQNADLETESKRLLDNESALLKAIDEKQANLAAMVRPKDG